MLALSQATYPEIGATPFLSTMLSVQSDYGKELLSKSRMEVALIRATRQDAGSGLKGTIARGELLELILRFTWAAHENNPEPTGQHKKEKNKD